MFRLIIVYAIYNVFLLLAQVMDSRVCPLGNNEVNLLLFHLKL